MIVGGQWHHHAIVWNKDGRPGIDEGTRTIALFLDGKFHSRKWHTGHKLWVKSLTGGELRLCSLQEKNRYSLWCLKGLSSRCTLA